jgi:hypothetical protein
VARDRAAQRGRAPLWFAGSSSPGENRDHGITQFLVSRGACVIPFLVPQGRATAVFFPIACDHYLLLNPGMFLAHLL